MSIGSISQNWSSYLSTADQLIRDSMNGTDSADGTDSRSIIDEIASGGLLKYREKQQEEKIEAQVLSSMGLTDKDLKNLSPDKLEQVEKAVAQALEQQIKNTMKNQAEQQTQNAAKQVYGSNGTSLLADDTAAALFELQ